MNIINRFLSKSNQFNFYKENYEKLREENLRLSNEYNNLLNQKNNELNASSFCSWDFVDYFYRDDFGDKLNELVKDLPEYSQKYVKYLFLRTIAVNFIKKDSLFSNYELEEQKSFNEFVKNKENCPFNFIDDDYNVHCLMNVLLTDLDKEFIKNKDIIDAGAYTGDSSLPLSKLTSLNVHAFEPFEESFNKLVKNIKLNSVENIIPINASLSNYDGIMKLYLSGDNYQGITADSNKRQYDSYFTAESKTIDSYVEENNLNVGLINVDVEGEEKNLLEGAINTIKSQKPILFLSIYHNVDDFFDIKPWIDNLNLNYKFIVSKEQPWTFIADTVLECRPY